MSDSGFTSTGNSAAGRAPGGEGGPTLLGVCGKHRSYREHFEDVAHQSPLIAIKEAIYDRGIRAAVDAGVWRDLKRDDDDGFVPFAHTMVGRRIAGGPSRDWVVGLVVTSPDSIGRNAYPLLLFATGPAAGASPTASLEPRAARLRTLLADVMSATSLGEVQAAIAAARTTIARAAPPPRAPSASPGSPPPLPSAAVAPLVALADDPAVGENRRGLVHALREFRRRFAPSRTLVDRGLHVRVPRTAGSSEAAAARWIEMLDAELRVPLPTLAFVPDDRPWIDLIVGVPSADDFFCLHAPAAKLPPIGEIPFQLDPGFVAELGERIEFLRANPAAANASPSNPNDPGQDDRRDGRGWRRWLPWMKD